MPFAIRVRIRIWIHIRERTDERTNANECEQVLVSANKGHVGIQKLKKGRKGLMWERTHMSICTQRWLHNQLLLQKYPFTKTVFQMTVIVDIGTVKTFHDFLCMQTEGSGSINLPITVYKKPYLSNHTPVPSCVNRPKPIFLPIIFHCPKFSIAVVFFTVQCTPTLTEVWTREQKQKNVYGLTCARIMWFSLKLKPFVEVVEKSLRACENPEWSQRGFFDGLN